MNVGLLGLLTVVFVVLKLAEVIDWSWWWVLFPSWGSMLFILIGASFMLGLSKRED